MTDDRPPPPRQADAIERFADALHDLLSARATSWGLLDVAVEVDGWHVDAELLFTAGPDMGATLDTSTGTARFCELIGDSDERWLDDAIVDGVDVHAPLDDDALRELVLRVADGVLAARRPLLRDDADA